MNDALVGLLLTLVGGMIGSTTLMPIKYVRAWKWENTWLVYSAFAYLILPWILAFATVPHLLSLYTGVQGKAVLQALLFGLAWGVGVVLYGYVLDIVGLSISSGIILGTSVALGSLIPLLLISGVHSLGGSGRRILAADGIMIVGVLLCAHAGGLRQKAAQAQQVRKHDARFFKGLCLAFVAGLLSPLLNVAFTLGAPITQRALESGVQPFNASNGVWALAVGAGSLPSIAFCVLKLYRKGGWNSYSVPYARFNFLLCVAMGSCFIVSTICYGAAAGRMGLLGPVIGWPIYISALILGNNFWGWYTLEWKGIAGRPVWTMQAGILLQIVAMVLLGLANQT